MGSRTVAEAGEHALIERIRARLTAPPWVIVGPGDDAAVVAPARGMLEVLTTDAQVEGVHFDRTFVPPAAIGHRALAVNLSDLAAMGAQPRMALLSLILPPSLRVETLDGIVDGLIALALTHAVAIVGGNITRSTGPLVVDVTAIGSVKPRRVLTRAGARPGDLVFVTGALGDAAAGLQQLRSDGAAADGGCARRFLYPEPRIRAGTLLGRNRIASACVDLSDGLGDGVRQLADASGVGVALDARTFPISAEARAYHHARGTDPVEMAVAGGDDYELLFTIPPRRQGRLRGALREFRGVPATQIGVVTKGRDVLLNAAGGARELPKGYEHFR